ncbi:MAG TPA: hypothetical protein VF594_02870 [Rubricoccaceae bacterium]
MRRPTAQRLSGAASRRRLSPVALVLVAAALAGTAHAQGVPDSTARPPLLVPGAASGRVVSPVPAVTSALSAESFLDMLPGAFSYALGAPGRSGGASVDGLDPARPALLLDGRPFDDLITGAPRLDLLPLAALGPLRLSDSRLGRPVAVEAETRTFRLGRPITELRYLAGQSGVQNVSATHAQTRLPPAFLRGGSRDARLTLAGHVLSRAGRGTLAGATLRHTDVLARALLTRPRASGSFVLDAGVLATDRTDGARRGVVPGTATDIFQLSARVVDPTATRRTIRAEVWTTAQLSLLTAQPTTVTLSGVLQRLVYRSDEQLGPDDTLRVHARRASVRIAQPLGGSRIARLGLSADAFPATTAGPLGSPGLRLRADAAVGDSVVLGPFRAVVEGGALFEGGHIVPAVAVRVARGRFGASVRLGGAAPSVVEANGLTGAIRPGSGAAERALLGDLSGGIGGPGFLLDLRAFGNIRWNARLLVSRDTAFAVETAAAPLMAAGATARLAFRSTAARGLYATLAATAHVPIRADASPLARRDADALPRLHGAFRLGTRAAGIGDGVLDLDLALVGRAWTAFRGRIVEPRTGLLALPDPGADFGTLLPARGVLGAEATATFSRRATVFLQIDHALGEFVGAAVVQGEPLPIRVVRFGVFWALLD